MDPHRLAEERSIAFHRAIAVRLRDQPEWVERAKERVRAWAASGAIHPQYAASWLAILDLPTDRMCERVVDPSETMRALRQCTPFAGILTARERWAIWRRAADEVAP